MLGRWDHVRSGQRRRAGTGAGAAVWAGLFPIPPTSRSAAVAAALRAVLLSRLDLATACARWRSILAARRLLPS